MIVTVTANPALDRTIIVKDFKIGKINRVIRSRVDAGGKGINVAKNVKALGGDAACLGFLGGDDDFIVKYLEALGIAADFTVIQNSIRVNIKLIDENSSTFTDINELGPEVNFREARALIEKIKYWALRARVLVLAGSLPPGIERDFYREAILSVRDSGAKVILDAENDALKYGIEAAPYLIKPNIHELSGLVGKKLKTPEDIIAAALPLIERGVEVVSVSMGPRGSLTVTRDRAYSVPPLDVEVRSTAGAGDAMVAGFALALENGLDIRQAVKMASAAAACAVTREGTQPVDVKVFSSLIDKVRITEIHI
ncbi:1-phosphofructokinase [Thermosediminibacter litoriperuensis]|uniref:1-phosphofructokinase n=1 Tax=Thermosediminibacter litoriperuensis TaxID=291989 RepID=UPI0011E74B92|nr:1-phosphofructokinase [Thermosediminibacter litoriperuensis]